MDLKGFKTSLNQEAPPADAGRALRALWHAAKDDWHQAHRLAQAQRDEGGAWVHAYLHRLEGDRGNAGHWYRRAGKPPSTLALEAEWEEIVAALL